MPPQLDELLARVDQCSTQAIELSTHFQELREQIRQAIDIAQRDPEMSLIRSRKVLEYIVVDIYDEALKPKRAGTQPLEGLVQALVKEGQFPNRLAAYADMVRGLGNVGAHSREKGVSSQDVLNSLSNLLPIVEWFFEHRKTSGAEVARPPEPSAQTATPDRDRVGRPVPQPRQRTAAPDLPVPELAEASAHVGSNPVARAQRSNSWASLASVLSGSSRRVQANRWAIGVGCVLLAALVIWHFTRQDDSADRQAAAISPPTKSGSAANSVAAVGSEVKTNSSPAATPPLSAAAPAAATPETITNSIGMKLTLIPAGEFTMGSPENVPGAFADEHPPHPVRITKPFYLGTYSVTRGQFSKFVAASNYKTDAEKYGDKNDWRNPGFAQTDDHPAVDVSWNDAVAFCKWLSHQEGKTYRLPTEAEWEYACRAGTKSAYFFGDDPGELGKYAWYSDNSGVATHEVGQKLPNPLGLYDILGNAMQWCSDWWAADYYKNSPPVDPQGPAAGSERVARGGNWHAAPASCRCSSRLRAAEPALRAYDYVGFRVVREP